MMNSSKLALELKSAIENNSLDEFSEKFNVRETHDGRYCGTTACLTLKFDGDFKTHINYLKNLFKTHGLNYYIDDFTTRNDEICVAISLIKKLDYDSEYRGSNNITFSKTRDVTKLGAKLYEYYKIKTSNYYNSMIHTNDCERRLARTFCNRIDYKILKDVLKASKLQYVIKNRGGGIYSIKLKLESPEFTDNRSKLLDNPLVKWFNRILFSRN